MELIREDCKTARQAVTERVHFVAWDFLKMLAAAILCGLAVSMTTAGIVLLLTSSAEARPIQRQTVTPAENTIAQVADRDGPESDQVSPTPGAILLGDGCGRTMLNAVERDWQVRIDGKRVEVRVMQAFQAPAESVEVATFFVQLVNGARLTSLTAQSSANDWTGQLIRTDDYDRLTPAEYLNLSRSRILVSHASRGTVMTSPLPGLKPADLITIEYTYVMEVDAAGDRSSFILPLEVSGEYAKGGRSPVGKEGPFPSSGGSSTRGAVWVEWIGRKPARVTGLPVDADLEWSKSRVEGFSWATREIQPGARFDLAWTH